MLTVIANEKYLDYNKYSEYKAIVLLNNKETVFVLPLLLEPSLNKICCYTMQKR